MLLLFQLGHKCGRIPIRGSVPHDLHPPAILQPVWVGGERTPQLQARPQLQDVRALCQGPVGQPRGIKATAVVAYKL